MMEKQVKRSTVTTMMQAFERFCELHIRAVPAWLAADYLRMSPQGLYQASERGWIAYFQHGRNRMYSWKDMVNYRHTASRKFKDNSGRPHEAGKAGFVCDVVPPAPPTKAQIAAEEKSAAVELHKQAVDAISGRAPWPFRRNGG